MMSDSTSATPPDDSMRGSQPSSDQRNEVAFTRRSALVASSLIALGATRDLLGAASPGDDEPLCGTCKTTGRIKHEHPPSVNEAEKDYIHCSIYYESDPDALGLDWMPCPKCTTSSKTIAAKREFDGEMAKRNDWLKQRRVLDKELGKSVKVCHLETPNYIMTFGIPQVKVGQVVYDLHKSAHLYAKRLEDLRAEFMALHQLTEDDMLKSAKPWIAMLDRLKDAQAVCSILTDRSFSGGQRVFLLGPNRAGVASWDDPEVCRTDEERYQVFVHLAAHFISHGLKDWHWWLFDKHGWMFEGIGFYWEFKKFGSPITTCYSEQSGIKLSTQHIEAQIKKLVTADNVRPLVSLVDKSASTLDELDRKFAWSYVDYLIWYDAKAFGKFLNLLLDNNQATRDCIKQTYGMTFPQVQERWLAFVRDQYATLPKKGPMKRTPRVVEKGGK